MKSGRRVSGDALAHNAPASVYFQSGRVDEAVKQFDEAIRLKPDEAVAHFNISLTATQAARDAAQHLLRAIASRPITPKRTQPDHPDAARHA